LFVGTEFIAPDILAPDVGGFLTLIHTCVALDPSQKCRSRHW